MANRLLLALVMLLAVDFCSAWGPIFEPLKGGWNMGRTALQALKSSSDGHEKEEDRRLQQQQQQHSTFYYDDVDFHQILNPPSMVSSSLVFEWGSLWEDLFIVEEECFGAECEEECSIPEEYKTPEAEEFDVMGYLGIKRAEPLRVKEGYDSAWE